jgi:hypothetical protein
MSGDMQQAFRVMCTSRGLWHGATMATQQDLSALFVTRTVQLYLRLHGRFAFVMPNAALDRRQFAGFRTGTYPDPMEPTSVAFSLPWDLRRLRPHFFPRAASVVFGRRNLGDHATPLPVEAERWMGRLPRINSSWHEVRDSLIRTVAALEPGGDNATASPYRTRFANGASVFPRVLFLVEDQPASPLGLAAGGRAVRSNRSAYEKKPWRDLDRLEGVVEADFVRPIYLGENMLPYRLLQPESCVVPWDGTQLMDGKSGRIDLYPHLATWWRKAEGFWLENRSSERLTLLDRLDFRHGFRNQFPVKAQRVVYSKAGMHLAAARVTDPTAVIDHTLYWATVSSDDSDDEALYLCAVLNSPRVTEHVRPLMSYGKDERHIDMAVWRLPIPLYDPDNERHRRLAELGRRAEDEIAELDIDEARHFPALRRQVRKHLADSATGQQIDALVDSLLIAVESTTGL